VILVADGRVGRRIYPYSTNRTRTTKLELILIPYFSSTRAKGTELWPKPLISFVRGWTNVFARVGAVDENNMGIWMSKL
jgi:hypothetical protein